MLFIINADGTVQTTFPSQVYQGSNAASDIIVVAPWVSGAAITVSFELPNGARTTPSLVTPQESPVTLDGVEYRAWRALLPYAVTQYAGTVKAQFSIYTGTQTVTSSAATFEVYAGAVPELPDTPDANVYAEILAALGVLDGYYKDLSPRLQEAEADIAAETNAREAADTALGQRVDSVESGLTSEAAARQTADTALGNRIDAVEGDIDGKVDKVQAGSNYKVYGVKPANSGGAQTSIDATEFATKGNTIVMRDQNGIFYVKDPVYDSQPVNLRTQTAAINAAKTEVKGYVDTRFSQFDIITIVSELPATGEPNRLYLVTKTGGTSGDLFDEYVWENGAWERVGSARVDLSQYATVAQLDGYLEKVSTSTGQIRAYGVTSEGAQQMYVVEKSATSQSIARRDAGGVLSVSAATAAGHAVNLGQMESYVAGNAFPKLEGVAAGYRLVGIKSNGDPVLYVPNNYSTEANSIAQRGTGGTLVVGTPTADTHATTKKFVDEKCVMYNISTDTGDWYDAPVSGPPDQQDARAVLLSDIGVNITGAKGFMWTLHNEGAEGESGCSALVPCTPTYNGGKVQIDTEELYILGSQTIYRFLNLIVFY